VVLPFTSAAYAADIGTAFNYQGFLEKPAGTPVGSPTPVNCDFEFTLWNDDDLSAPENQIGPTLTFDGVGGNPPSVAVAAGVFTVPLDFGAGAIDGTARWLEIHVKCPPDVGFSTLAPRVELTPVPHALALPGLYTIQELAPAAGITPPPKLRISLGPAAAVSIAAFDEVNPAALRLKTGDTLAMELNPVTSATTVFGSGGLKANRLLIDAAVASNTAGSTPVVELVTLPGQLELQVDGQTVDRWTGIGSTEFGLTANRISGLSNTVEPGFHGCGVLSGGGPGFGNVCKGDFCTIAGGVENQAYAFGTVSGGTQNIAKGRESTVPGGLHNEAGGDYSFTAGQNAQVRDPTASGDGNGDEGTFAWADYTPGLFTSTGPDQFLIRATNGMRLATGDGSTPWFQAVLASNTNGGTNLALQPLGGNVGIGTNSPQSRLDVRGDSWSDAGRVLVGNLPAETWVELWSGAADGANPPAILWSDATVADDLRFGTGNFDGTSFTERMRIKGDGNVGIGTSAPTNPLEMASGAHVTGGGVWTDASSREIKENFAEIDARKLLESVANLPVTRWNYRIENKETKHIGPVAEDFHAAFDTGEDGKHLAALDTAGVALAAIQGLYEIVQEKDCEIEGLKSDIEDLRELVNALIAQNGDGR